MVTWIPTPARRRSDQPRSGQRRMRRRRIPAVLPRRFSPRRHCRRQLLWSGPDSFGLLLDAALRVAVHQSVSVSSPRRATAASIRSLKRLVFSPSAASSGVPKSTAVRPGDSLLAPLPKISPVPSMCTGMMGALVRVDR